MAHNIRDERAPLQALIATPRRETGSLFERVFDGLGAGCTALSSPTDTREAIFHQRPHLLIVDTRLRDWKELVHHVLRSAVRPHIALIASEASANQLDASLPVDLLLLEPVSEECIAVLLSLGDIPNKTPDFSRLLALSSLSGPQDEAIHRTCHALASAFQVDECRYAQTAGAESALTQTMPAMSRTSETDRHCATAARLGITLLTTNQSGSASYLGNRLRSSSDSALGELCLVSQPAALFGHQTQLSFRTVCNRLASEFGWRDVHHRLLRDHENLREVEHLDPKIGVWNRSATEHLTAMQCASARREERPLSIAVFDIENLKGINDSHGLHIGDQVLRHLADAVRETVRAEDVVGRYGGDEIAVALVGARLEDAQRVITRVLDATAHRTVNASGTAVQFSTTAGITLYSPRWDRSETALARAARAADTAQRKSLPFMVIDETERSGFGARAASSDVGGGLTLAGSYRLLHEISRGGMGVVYRAEDISLGRQVAVKMLRPDLASDDKLVKSFRSEAAILAQLRHPNLVQIYAFGTDRDDTYFAMELVEGESVRDALDRCVREHTAMPTSHIVSVVKQTASALDALHDHGITHRDVKPANIVLDPFRNRAVLVDVGIARRHHEGLEPAGTPGYIAPEVIGGEDATGLSDVYGLAATAYEMLSKNNPWGPEFSGHSLVRAQLSERPHVISDYRPELAALDRLFVKALSRVPQGRFTTAGEFAAALESTLQSIGADKDKGSPRQASGTPVGAPTTESVDEPARGAKTRGIVFRSIPRVLGVRDTHKWRSALSLTAPDLANALRADVSPLGWVERDLFLELLNHAPETGKDPVEFARSLGHATIRGSFRRFFPASSVTLVPSRTLSALNIIWGRYQSWGKVMTVLEDDGHMLVRVTDAPSHPLLCHWITGLIEQLVTFAGGKQPLVAHSTCVASDGDDCLFEVSWN